MFDPVVMYGADARYGELRREAEWERQAKRRRRDVLTLLAVLHMLRPT